MRILLDTHTVLWMVSDDPKLSPEARQAIGGADEVFWSVLSLWEIAIKLGLGRPDFRLGEGWARLIPEEMTRNRIGCLPIEARHCEELTGLPWHHRDPFDRLLAAQARAEQLDVVSRDESFATYGLRRIW